jgi:hypothetical protein
MRFLGKPFFALYGLTIGALYATILHRNVGLVATAIVSAVLGILLVFFGWRCAGKPDWPSWRLVILLPPNAVRLLRAIVRRGVLLHSGNPFSAAGLHVTNSAA